MGAHWTEILVLAGVALLFFGPKRLPEMGSAIGKTVREFQRSMRASPNEIAHEAPRTDTAEAVEPAAPAGMIAAADTRSSASGRTQAAPEEEATFAARQAEVG